jgi:hypothetical protein
MLTYLWQMVNVIAAIIIAHNARDLQLLIASAATANLFMMTCIAHLYAMMLIQPSNQPFMLNALDATHFVNRALIRNASTATPITLLSETNNIFVRKHANLAFITI